MTYRYSHSSPDSTTCSASASARIGDPLDIQPRLRGEATHSSDADDSDDEASLWVREGPAVSSEVCECASSAQAPAGGVPAREARGLYSPLSWHPMSSSSEGWGVPAAGEGDDVGRLLLVWRVGCTAW